jgi:hypothetical protein
MCAMRPSPNGFWLPVCIAKVIGIFGHWVTSMPRLAFEGLEPCDGKLSRRVLRGLGVSNDPRLPGILMELCYWQYGRYTFASFLWIHSLNFRLSDFRVKSR